MHPRALRSLPPSTGAAHFLPRKRRAGPIRCCSRGPAQSLFFPGQAPRLAARLIAAFLAAGIGPAFGPAAADDAPYRLPVGPGDVLSVSVAQAPEFDHQSRIDALGRIMLPQIGAVTVGGLEPDQAAAAVATALAERDIVLSPTVTVEVASYRPFYVDGTVAHPGAFDYQPGLTVRHALVLAGGLDTATGGKLTVADLLELNNDWKMTAYQLLEVNSRIARLQAELDRNPEIVPPKDATGNVTPTERQEIETIDSAILQDKLTDLDANEQHLQDLKELVDFEIGVLAQQIERREQENALQNTELENARSLADKGLISQPKLRELEREQSRLSRELLDVQSVTARAKQNKETLTHDLEAAAREWRVNVRSEIRKALLERTEIEAKLDLLRTSLVAAGLQLNEMGETPDRDPEVAIFRVTDGAEREMSAGMATPVLPGDVLRVSLGRPPQG